MNLFNYWLRVKRLYPMATTQCVEFFQRNYTTVNWRTRFKDPDEILACLERRKIHIITRKRRPGNDPLQYTGNHDGKICFELRCWEESTITAYRFTDRPTAPYDAIERAFRIPEQRELRKRGRGNVPFQWLRKQREASKH